MRKGKYAAPKARCRGGFRTLTVALSLTMALCCAVGGTIAWLTSTPDPIQNTFTIGDINISLSDKKNIFQKDGSAISTTATTTTYVPGQVITTNPTVTVEAGSEACYLFIHIKEENNTFGTDKQKIIQWGPWTPTTKGSSVAWIAVEGHSGYYYRKVDKLGDTPANYEIFASNLTVNEDLEKSDIETMKTAGYPTITITAAAVQRDSIPNENSDKVAAAWALLPADFKPSGN